MNANALALEYLDNIDSMALFLELEATHGNPADTDALIAAALHLRDAMALLRPLAADAEITAADPATEGED